MLLAFLLCSGLVALGIGYLAVGQFSPIISPALKAWGIGASVALLCYFCRSSLIFAAVVFAVAAFFFLAPFVLRVA